jgi:hypothetical protein
LRYWRNLSSSKEPGDLIFDESPYKVYTAKITGTPVLKYVPFDGPDGQRVYKGEGTVQFTCHWPYAHTPNKNTKIPNFWGSESFDGLSWFDGKKISNYLEEFYPTKE